MYPTLAEVLDLPVLRAAVPRVRAGAAGLEVRVRWVQMLETLFAYLEAGGGMTAFAAKIGLSRPSAYARLARLRQVMRSDLDDCRTRLSLHLAMLALRQGPATSDGAPAGSVSGSGG